jgi:hypothetical protein
MEEGYQWYVTEYVITARLRAKGEGQKVLKP